MYFSVFYTRRSKGLYLKCIFLIFKCIFNILFVSLKTKPPEFCRDEYDGRVFLRNLCATNRPAVYFSGTCSRQNRPAGSVGGAWARRIGWPAQCFPNLFSVTNDARLIHRFLSFVFILFDMFEILVFKMHRAAFRETHANPLGSAASPMFSEPLLIRIIRGLFIGSQASSLLIFIFSKPSVQICIERHSEKLMLILWDTLTSLCFPCHSRGEWCRAHS